MPVITLNDQQYSLNPGRTRLGSGVDADLRVGDDESLGVQAVVEVDAGDGAAAGRRAVIRRAADGAAVRVNGVPLVEPTPLMHGDKVEIAGLELFYSDDGKAGATQYVSSSDVAAIAAKRAGPARATSATGGRLVSLVDGKEYPVPESGLTIGRDATSGVVVAQNDVSRRHAEVAPVENGYRVRDFSANGLYVNGARVQASQLLSRADVIRVGSEEFRFYADVAPMPPVAPAPKAAVSSAAAPDAPPVASTVPVAPAPSFPAFPAFPALTVPPRATAPADMRPVLAVLEVTNEGPGKGQQYAIRSLLSHVGRGAHNDVVIADDSVSDTHAKLQRRDDGWYLVDAGSTNGTYVAGARIAGEMRLDGAPDVRFGGVKLVFRPRDGTVDTSKGTRAIAAVDRAKLGNAAAPPAPVVGGAPPASGARRGPSVWLWLLVALAIAGGAAFFLMKH